MLYHKSLQLRSTIKQMHLDCTVMALNLLSVTAFCWSTEVPDQKFTQIAPGSLAELAWIDHELSSPAGSSPAHLRLLAYLCLEPST